MRAKLLTLFIVAFIACKAEAQTMGSEYKTALGVKIYPASITVKHFMQTNKAIEGLGYFWEDGMRITALYEIHGDINGLEGLKWYVGPGAHIGFWSDRWKQRHPHDAQGGTFGIDGVLGLDYKITGAPINVSLDWQPSFNFVGYNYFEGGWGGLGIRYTF